MKKLEWYPNSVFSSVFSSVFLDEKVWMVPKLRFLLRFLRWENGRENRRENGVWVPSQLFHLRKRGKKRSLDTIQTFSSKKTEEKTEENGSLGNIQTYSSKKTEKKTEFGYHSKFFISENWGQNVVWVPMARTIPVFLDEKFEWYPNSVFSSIFFIDEKVGMVPKFRFFLRFLRWKSWDGTQTPFLLRFFEWKSWNGIQIQFSRMRKLEWYPNAVFSD